MELAAGGFSANMLDGLTKWLGVGRVGRELITRRDRDA